jgi:hypothetical protein
MIEDLKRHLYSLLDRVRGMLSAEEFETALELVRKVILGFQNDERTSEVSVRTRRIIEIE